MENTTENTDSLNGDLEADDTSLNVANENNDSENVGQEVKPEENDKLVQQLVARAKRAEAKLKALKESLKDESPAKEAQPTSTENEDEAIKNLLNIVDLRVKEKLDDKEFDALDVSDEAKKELRVYAKANSLSARDVLKTDFFKFMKDKEEAKALEEKASIGGKRGAPSKKDFSEINPAKDFDLRTEEGQKAYEEWKEWLKTQ